MKNYQAEYEFYLKRKGYAKRTITSYLYELKKFLNYLEEKITDLRNLTKTHLKNYFDERYYYLNHKGRQNSAKTRNFEITVIKSFLGYLYDREYIADLRASLTYVKEPRLRLPKNILTKKELLKLFSFPDTKTIKGFQHRMILELFYATGMRREELVNLKLKDINLKAETVRINQGKNHQDRVVPINETTAKYLDLYIREIRPQITAKIQNQSKKTDYLVITENGRMSGISLGYALRPYFKKLKKEVSIHSLRHTVATHLIQRGMPVRYVQELLGHKQLSTTIRYLQLNIQELQKEYLKCHPRAAP